MRTKVTLVLVGVFALCAVGVWAKIDGSGHDFEAASWNTTDQDICGPCHTPHGAANNVQAPLWNHTNAVMTGYTPYTSDTFNAGMAQPDGESVACLSCHDGVVSVDAYGGNDGGTKMGTLNGGAKVVGKDMSDDHPISFLYSDSLATDELKNDAAVTNLLFSGKVQCSSCHDVHNSSTDTVTNLLVMSNVGSALCLTCHDK